ncbi:hypothetical protein A4A49_05951 [Nicotiana attenuata]|uniref:Uncharacterized protein n=1 Tax=Nicotiana attenuata TaxID=49451 RepID=A0A314KYI8_NICAT|nr:hypothetical protein A4A49_05951 [Nicotiana attenuata]
MPTAPPFGGGKPPDQSQKMRNSKAYKPPLGASLKQSPAATNLNLGGALIVAKNRPRTSEISQGFSGPNFNIPNHRDDLSSQSAPPHQFSDISTVEIVSDELKNSGVAEMVAASVPGAQIEKARYQNARPTEENTIDRATVASNQQVLAVVAQLEKIRSKVNRGVPVDPHAGKAAGQNFEKGVNDRMPSRGIEVVGISAMYLVEAGQKFMNDSAGVEQMNKVAQLKEKKKDAGDDRRLKDIPASTILSRMYTTLGTNAQVEEATACAPAGANGGAAVVSNLKATAAIEVAKKTAVFKASDVHDKGKILKAGVTDALNGGVKGGNTAEKKAEDWTMVSSKKGTPNNFKMQHIEKSSRDGKDTRSSSNPFNALVNVNDDEGKVAGKNLHLLGSNEAQNLDQNSSTPPAALNLTSLGAQILENMNPLHVSTGTLMPNPITQQYKDVVDDAPIYKVGRNTSNHDIPLN